MIFGQLPESFWGDDHQGGVAVRTLAIAQNVTADGAVEMLGDRVDPTAEDRQVAEAMNRFTERGDALLLGRQTSRTSAASGPSRPTTAPVSSTRSTACRSMWCRRR